MKKQLSKYFEAEELTDFTLSFDIADECEIFADREVLERIFNHLLENVRRHGKAFFKIELIKDRHEYHLLLANQIKKKISNPNELENSFNRVKIDNSEQLTSLGLLIAAQLIDLAAGSKSLVIEEEIFSVYIDFPIHHK